MTCPLNGYRRGSSQPKTGSSLRSSQAITTYFRRFWPIVAIVAVAGGPFVATVAIAASLADCNYIYSSSFYGADEAPGGGTAKSATIATITLNPAENCRFRRRSALRRPATTATIAVSRVPSPWCGYAPAHARTVQPGQHPASTLATREHPRAQTATAGPPRTGRQFADTQPVAPCPVCTLHVVITSRAPLGTLQQIQSVVRGNHPLDVSA